MTDSSFPKFETLAISFPAKHVIQVELNRPSKRNAMNKKFWSEMLECGKAIDSNSEIRAVVVSGAGKMFTSGLDVTDHADVFGQPAEDTSRKGFALRSFIMAYQAAFSILEDIPQPVIAAVHSACVGGGVDLISACDIRVCSEDAWFSVKEVDIGMAADVGTLQRLPRVMNNQSLVRELVYTGRKLTAAEAKEAGLVSGVYKTKEETVAAAVKLAAEIASKSPIAVVGSKFVMNYSRDHTVKEGLEYVANWNMTMLQSPDMVEAMTATMTKRPPIFSKL